MRRPVSSHVSPATAIRPASGASEAGDRPQHRRLARTRRSDERERRAVADAQLDSGDEATEGMGELEVERHRVTSLTDSRVAALVATSTALIARATSKSRSNCS